MTRQTIALEITCTLADLGPQTYYFATEGFRTSALDTPALVYFAEKVESIGEYRRELFSGARMAGATRASRGSIVITNDGSLDVFSRLTSGATVVARIGEVGAPYPAGWVDLFVTYIDSAAADFSQLRLELRDLTERLNAPIVTAQFSGTGGLEGTVAANVKKQLVLGQPGLLPMVLLDPVKQVYYLQANATDVATLSGLAPFGVPFEGGVPVGRGVPYVFADFMLEQEPDPGTFRMWAGYGGTTLGGKFGSEADAMVYVKGPVYIRLGTPPVFDMRFGATGLLQNTAADTPRRWRFTDLCNRAGLSAVGPATLATVAGERNDFDAGNHLIDGDQTYVQTMSDRAQAVLGAFGFDRLGRFYCARLLDPEETANALDVSAYTFTEHNSGEYARTAVPGIENPAYQVNVKAGRAFKSGLASGASTEMQSILQREGFLVAFSGTCDAVRQRYPGAQSVSIEIDGHDFPDSAAQLQFVQRFGLLFGKPRFLLSLTCYDFSAQALAIELMSKVTLRLPRFGFDAGVALRVVTVAHDYKLRRIRFGLWGGDDGHEYAWALGGGNYPAGSGDPGGSYGGPLPPAAAPSLSKLRDTIDPIEGYFTGAISFAGALESAIDAIEGVFTGDVAAPAGDPNFASVALLLHFDGTDGSTTITDSSSYADGKTSSAPILIETSDSVWGGACLQIPSGTTDEDTGANWSPGSSRFARSSGTAYTIECWFKKTGATTAGAVARLFNGILLWRLQATSTSNGWNVNCGGTSTNFTATTGDWHFCQTVIGTDNVAVTKIDGTTVQTTSALSPWTGTPYPVLNPAVAVSGGDLRVEDLRITVGVARAFAVPSAAFPDF